MRSFLLLRAHTTRSTQPPLFFIISPLNIKWNWWCVCESFGSIVQCVVVCIYMVRSPTRDIIQCMISRISCVSFIHSLFFSLLEPSPFCRLLVRTWIHRTPRTLVLVMISYGFFCSVPAFYLLFNPNVFSICSNHKAIGSVFQGSVESSGESEKKVAR